MCMSLISCQKTSIDGKISNPYTDLEDVKTLTENTRILTIGYAGNGSFQRALN